MGKSRKIGYSLFVLVSVVAFAAIFLLSPAAFSASAATSPVTDLVTELAYQEGYKVKEFAFDVWNSEPGFSTIDYDNYYGTVVVLVYKDDQFIVLCDGDDSFSGDETAELVAGDYEYTVSWEAEGDYEAGFEIVQLTVVASSVPLAQITGVSVSQTGSLTYNGEGQRATVSTQATTESGPYTFYYSTDRSAWSTEVPAFVAAGSHTVYYKVTADGHEDFGGTENDSFAVSIGQESVTVNFTVVSKEYTGGALLPTYSGILGVIAGDRSDVSVAFAAGDMVNVGNYDKVFSLTGAKAGNYALTASSVNFSITPCVVTYTVALTGDGDGDLSVVYDGQEHLLSVTVTNKKNEDDVAITVTENAAKTNANEAGYVATLALTGERANQYAFQSGEDQIVWSIVKADPVLTAPQKVTGSIYDGTPKELITEGNTTGGTLLYSKDGATWGVTVPTEVNAGTGYTVYYKVNGGTNYNDIGANALENIVIDKATPVFTTAVAANTAEDLTYTGLPQNLVKTAGAVTFGTVQYAVSYGGEKGAYGTLSEATGRNAGTYLLYYKVVGDSNVYDVAENALAAGIDKSTVTVTATDQTVQYGNSKSALAYTFDEAAFKNGETSASLRAAGALSGAPALSCGYIAGNAVGNYPITIAIGDLTATNYDFNLVGGTLVVVNQTAVLVVTVPGLTYSGAEKTVTAKYFKYNALTETRGEEVGDAAVAVTQGDCVHVGTFEVSFTIDSNFTLVAFDGCGYEATGTDNVGVQSYEILPKPITVTYVGSEKAVTYGDLNVWTALGEDMEQNGYYLNVSTVGGDEPSSVIDFWFYKEGDLTKTPVAMDGHPFLYAGKYLMTARGKNADYDVTVALGEKAYFTVNKAPVTVSPVTGQSKYYGDADGELTFTATVDFVSYDNTAHEFVQERWTFDEFLEDWGVTVSDVLTGALTREDGAVVGGYAINRGTLAIRAPEQGMDDSLASCLELLNANYDITFEEGILFSIEKRPITVSNVNPAEISVTYGDDSLWYYFKLQGQVTPAAIYQYITITGGSLAYGDPINAAVSATVKKGSVIFGAADFASIYLVGKYELAVFSTANYEVTSAIDPRTGYIEVTQRDLYVTAADRSLTYGEAVPAKFFTAEYQGFAWTEGAGNLGGNLVFVCEYDVSDPENRGTGSYEITPGGLASANYKLHFLPGVLTVGKKTVELTWGVDSFVYDKTAKLPSVSVGGTVYGETVTATVTGARVNVGDYVATATALDNGNYALPVTVDKSFRITKRAARVTAEDKESDYGDDLLPLTCLVSGIVEGDNVFEMTTLADKNVVGAYPITFTLLADGANYVVEFIPATYTVKAKAGKTEKIEKDAAEGDGVNIKGAIRNAVLSSSDKPLSIAIGEVATVVFDKAALTELAKADDVKITYTETREGIDRGNKAFKNAQLVIEISLGDATFAGGTATVTTAFENKAPAGKKAVVYYVDVSGKKTKVNATFSGGTVSFETGHFSTYVVEYVLTGGAVAGIVIACVVGAAGIAVGVLFLLKKKKEQND